MSWFRVSIEIYWVFVSGHQYRLDNYGSRVWLDISDGVEVKLVFMSGIIFFLVLASGSNLACFCAGIKIEFGCEREPKITRFPFIDPNWLGS